VVGGDAGERRAVLFGVREAIELVVMSERRAAMQIAGTRLRRAAVAVLRLRPTPRSEKRGALGHAISRALAFGRHRTRMPTSFHRLRPIF
jgi:hypothetical protein